VQAIIVTIGVTMITFLMLHLLPGSLAREVLGSRATPQAIAAFNRANDLNASFPAQYWNFLWRLLHGNLGYSFVLSRSVDSVVANDLPRDLVLGIPTLVISLLIAIPIGIWQAVRRNRMVDYVGTSVSFILYSMPSYAVALLLIQFLSISFHLLPAEAPQTSTWTGLLADPRALVLPIASFTLVSYAIFSRYMRSSAIDALAQDYIRTARAKGLPERMVLARHLLRNSVISVVTLVGLSIPYIITGGLIIEQVFNFDGLGLAYFNAAQQGDFELMLGVTVLVGIVTVLGNLMADIAYALLDKRVRY
jgi:peptide/nickel transport system permease protein